ncbi:uncharacterized protein LOC144437998 [Glandiceps talaboti]
MAFDIFTLVCLASVLSPCLVQAEANVDDVGKTKKVYPVTQEFTESTEFSSNHVLKTNKDQSHLSSTHQSDEFIQTNGVTSLSNTTLLTYDMKTTNHHETSMISPVNIMAGQSNIQTNEDDSDFLGMCKNMENVGKLFQAFCERMRRLSVTARIFIVLFVGVSGILLTLIILKYTRCKPIESHTCRQDKKEHILYLDDVKVNYTTETLQHWKLTDEEKDYTVHLLTPN